MFRSQSLSRFIQKNLSFRRNLKSPKSNRSIAPLLIAGVALLAAVVLSVSVESRSGGWLRKAAQPNSPASSPEAAKNAVALSPKHSLEPATPAVPLVPTVTATKVDTLLTDVDLDGKADPGDTLKYTVVIGATGMDATGVQFNDTVDPNTNFVPGTVMTTPLARNDSYLASGNIRITVAVGSGVLANDNDADSVGPDLTVSAAATSVNGGNVNLSADGSFTYNPPAGFEGVDTFTYTLSDNEGNTDTATASITVSGMIWFINNNSASCLTLAAGCGRLTHPFSTLAAFNALNNGTGNNPAANDNIFVYESAAAYVGPLTLLNGQKFIGQDATSTLSLISGVIPPAGSDALPATSPGAPIVNITSAGIGITVAQNNILRGFTGGDAATDISGTGFGTLNISDVTLNGNGQTLNLSTGTLNGSFASLSSTNSATTGLSLTSVAGSLSSGSTTVTNSTGIGISVNTSSAALGFANTSVPGSGGTAISLSANVGAITFGSLAISPDANQRGLLATDNTQTITATSGVLVTSGAAAVEISRASSTTPLAIALISVTTTGGPNGIFLRNTSGSFSVIGDGANTAVGGNNTGGTLSGSTGADGATAGNAVYLENAGNVTLRRIRINGNNQNNGIRGLNFSNFTLEFSTVSGSNGNNGTNDESSLQFDNLTGSGAITSCLIEGGFEDNLNVVNTSGSLNRLTISGTTFGFNSAAGGNNNLTFDAQNAGTTLNFTLKSSLIRGSHIDWLNAAANSGSTMDAVIGGPLPADGNSFDNLGANAFAGPLPNGNRLVTGSIGNMTLDIRNNTLKGSLGEAIRVRSSAAGALTGTMNARVRNNTIGVAATANSGSMSGSGVFVFGDGGSDMNVAVTNNSIFQYNFHGISLQFGDEINNGAIYNATVTGNTINTPGTLLNNFNGIELNNGTIAATDDFTSCVDIGGAGVGNNVTNSGKGAAAPNNVDIRLRQRFATTVRLPGYVGPARDNTDSDVAEVATYLAGRNTLATAAGNSVTTGGGYIGGAACTAPTVAAASITEESPVGSLSTESVTSGVSAAVERGDSTLFATRGENPNEQQIVKLTQSEVSAMVQAAIARWAEAGLSATNVAKLQSLSFEIADLPAGQLATATSSKITLDETAAGYGWFFDATPSDDNEFDVQVLNKELQTTDTSAAVGRVDLLTVLMRQLGSQASFGKSGPNGPAAWLMEGTLGTGERRAPAFSAPTIGKAKSAPGAPAKQARATNATEKRDASYQQVASKGPRSSRVMRNHATRAAAPASFVDVMLNIGDLPAGKSVTITFNVTVDNPYLGASNQVSNQGIVSGTNFLNDLPVPTDDPDVNLMFPDPTKTTIDQPDVTVAVAPASVSEDGAGNLVYTFTREGSTAAELTVNFSVGGTATVTTDYLQTGAATFNASSGTVKIPVGSSTATVTLDPAADTTVELDETAILTVVSGTSYDVGTPASASGTITNDDTDVTVAVAPSSVEEDGAPNLVYTFTRNGVTSGALTVNFTVGGTATFNTDYTQTGAATFTATDGTVTFGAGNSTATVTVDPTVDMVVEPNETVVLTVAAGTGYNVANPSEATGTITNDDADVSIAVAPSSVDEDGVPNLVYTFTRIGDTTGALVVNFTIGGTADAATDYTQTGATTFTPPNGSVTFAAGNATATVTVDPTADATSEANETVIFTLAAGVDYNIGAPSEATGTINNDDTTVSVAVAPGAVDENGETNLVYTFTRSDSSGALSVNFSVNGTATFNNDYTQMGAATFTPPTGMVSFVDGSLTATVTVDPSADAAVEPDETVVLTVTSGTGYTVGVPASATGTITNDDTEVTVAVSPLSTTEDGVTNLVYTFTRNGVTTGALSANFSIGGTADSATDYTQSGATTFTPPSGTVDFGAGISTVVVTIDPTADNSPESDETVILTVTSGTGYNVGTPSVATGTITNDDAGVTVAVAPSAVDEDGVPNLVYTFTRTGDTTGALTVNFSIGGTADFNTDYTQTGAATFTPPTGTVTFGAGSSTAIVTIDPTADVTSEPNETVILALTAGTGYEVGTPSEATGTINNDDNAVSVAVSPGAVNEDGVTNLVYTFTRGDSNGELTVNFSVGGTATFTTDYTQMGAATFTPPTGTVTFVDGSLTATVTVDPAADSTVELDETVILTVTAGAGYSVGVPASANGTITNDDTDVTVAVSPASVAEDAASNLVYTFTRNGVTSSALTVNFSVGGTATFSSDYMQSGAASFTPPTGTVIFGAGNSTATVTVTPIADGASEGDETVILTLAAGTGYNVAIPSTATGTIINDDTEVTVAVSPSSVFEDGANNLVYTFNRTGIISSALIANFSVGGTASFSGADFDVLGETSFDGTNGTVMFLAGSSTAQVTIDPFGDATQELDETVILTVTSGAGYNVGMPSSATGTILNDDNSPPTVTVGYGQCGGGTAGTLNLIVADVETAAGSLILTATSSNTAVVPLANISFGGSGANRTVSITALMKNTVQFSDVTITVSDGVLMSSINIRVIVGTNKTETISIGTTTVGTDMIFGGNGDDTVNSGGGNDLICGGNGGGIVNGGVGDDTIDGGNGNDTLRGGDGNDLILGGGGNDILEGGNDNDTIDGGAGVDTIRGESGNDTLTGGSGADSFNGGPGNDTVTDFNVGQGDTKDISVEIASLFGANEWGGVLAYLASPPRWWISPFTPATGYFMFGNSPGIGNNQ
jgi:Ca2+-binding RTX toxin-like protein